ncbi:MAG: TIGR04282 family arsenosugar biosynthesis glycosyltransferase [Gammaproteobacteria bacterium]|nr:MAG: TIGR04282 family arsenosugar biosynthesis glycosyltransferase [Gammaproteobacteria bacterium]
MSMVTPELILFARQPVAGEVKTRLQPQYTPEQAASIAQYLIETSVVNAVNHWAGPVSIYATPDITHPIFHRLAAQYGLKLYRQNGNDLGLRMHAAIKEGIKRHGAAAVMGCDIPHCPQSVFESAFDLMANKHAVLGPTRDGGYYFVGLAEPYAELFTAIEWGTDKVLPDTLSRAASLEIDIVLLSTLQDIDTASDMLGVARIFPGLAQFLDQGATATAATAGGATETMVTDRD